MPDFHKQLLVKGDDFLLDRHVKRLLKAIVDPGLRDFNFERFSARDVTAVQASDRALTSAMMAEARTVVIDDFESYGKDDLEVITNLIKRGNFPTHLILIAAKIDKRTAFYKEFVKHGEVIEFKKPYANQVPDLLRQEAKTAGLDFETGALDLLVQIAGHDLMTLTGELEKLSLFAYPETKVTRRHVNELAVHGLADNVFALGERLGTRNLPGASKLYRQIREQGEAVVRIAALAIGHFRKIALARDALDRGEPRSSLPVILGIPPFFAKDYERQASGFSAASLRGIFGRLMRLSEELRSSPIDADILFENFLVETCRV